MKKRDKVCKIIRKITRIEFDIEKGLLRSTRLCFKDKLPTGERVRLENCLRKKGMGVITQNEKCIFVR